MTRTRLAVRWERILKAFRMAFSIGAGRGDGSFSAWRMGTLPGSQLDVEELAGDVLLNGAVAICLGWMADNFPEPHLRVTRGTRDGQPDPVFDHPLPRLIADPNPHYDGDALWAATVMSYAAHGNAYWLKVRDAEGYGRPVELWYLPHWQVTPR